MIFSKRKSRSYWTNPLRHKSNLKGTSVMTLNKGDNGDGMGFHVWIPKQLAPRLHKAKGSKVEALLRVNLIAARALTVASKACCC